MTGPPIPAGGRGPLFTDQYQLVMAQVYLREGLAQRTAQFDYSYRSNPDYGSHQAGFVITAGLAPLLEWMAEVRVEQAHVDALAALEAGDGSPLFDDAFLEWLAAHGHFGDLQVEAVPEGRVVHPHLPVVTVTGPLAQAQLLETALLNFLNYPSLIATKAARLAEAARGAPVLEFGMRRGPGVAVDDAARAALIGGLAATSNVQAALANDSVPKGTHAHSLVQAFMATEDSELAAFEAFARAYPDDCILLVDTVDTLRSGVPNAIRVFQQLREAGHEPTGVRLDSGDLAYLSVQAARQLDEAGFTEARIVLSNELDELVIWQILTQMADEAVREGVDWLRLQNRMMYGVGTRLITSRGASALDGVYKLVGLQDDHGRWKPAVKLSENPVKVPIPGRKSAWRIYDSRELATADVITGRDDTPLADGRPCEVFHPHRDGSSRVLMPDQVARVEPLYEVVFADGRPTSPTPDVDTLRQRARQDIDALDPGVRRLVNPHTYHVSLDGPTKGLLRERVEAARAHLPEDTAGPQGSGSASEH